MSNNPYEHRRLFCKRIPTKRHRVRVYFNLIPGICFGIYFPMTQYCDASISFLFINFSIKWRRR